MNPMLLISLIVILALLIIVNVYLLAYFCHPDDAGWGASLFCKFLVVIPNFIITQSHLHHIDLRNDSLLGHGSPSTT